MTGGRFEFRLRDRAKWVDADAFGLLGAFRQAADAAGWSKEEIDGVIVEAVRGDDFAHLFRTLAWHVTDPDGRWPGDQSWPANLARPFAPDVDVGVAGIPRARRPDVVRSRATRR